MTGLERPAPAQPLRAFSDAGPVTRSYRKYLGKASVTLLAVVILSAYLLPLLYMVTTAFQQPGQASTPGAPFYPAKPQTGVYEGREAIREWIVATMASVSGMSFPIEWYVIDGNRVIMYCWNVFDPLPGMTGEYKFAVVGILEYAGNGQWSLEEDVYNAKEAEAVLVRFLEDAAAAGHAPPAPVHD